MNFGLMFQPLKKYVDFEGRARRQEFWLFVLFVVAVALLLVGLNQVVFAGREPSPITYALGIFLLIIFFPALALRVRRLHDTNRSGWWLLINAIPLIGALTLLVFDLLPGTAGPNRYGPDPKASTKRLVEVF